MRTIGRLLLLARDLWPFYLGILVSSLAVAATGLLTPFIIAAATTFVVDVATGQASGIATAVWLALALLGVELANTALTNVGGYLGDTMAVRLRAELSRRYYDKLLRLPQRYFDDELTGTIINRLGRSITETTTFLNSFANNFFPMLLTVAAILVITAFYSWPIAILLIVVYPIFMWLTTITSSRWQRLEADKNREYDLAGGRFAEVVGQIRVVKSFAQEQRELRAFMRHYDESVQITRQQSRYWHWMDVTRRSALNVIFFAVFAIIFVQTARGVFSIGAMVLLIQLVTMARAPIYSMSFLVDTSQRAVAGSRDYLAVLAEAEEPGAGAVEAGSVNSAGGLAISFDEVGFGYSQRTPVLQGVSFEVPAGARVAFVGESGGGKTTLVSLLLRLYDPDTGTIRIGGHDIANLPLVALRELVGVVFQEPALFSGTIRENIAYARPHATMDEIAEAATAANAHEFISKFADGYDSQIGERGLKLSGGQKQRIAVARAMLKDAPVLILDEATSSLDSKSERLVQEGLDRLMENRTTLIIAHRLATISAVDTIVTLVDGRVGEIGTPDELAGSGGIYSELLALQASDRKRDRKRLHHFDIKG